jgi:hypothetical protein
VKIQRATLRVAFFFLGVLSFSCRQDDSATGPSPIAFKPTFTVGDRYFYDAILTDEFGYGIYSSRSHATWRVLSTGGTSPGFSSITMFQDSSIILRDTTSILDTVFIALTPNGDLYRFGFLATIARIHKRPPPPDNWDCFAVFSNGMDRSWLVGYMDAERTQPVYGRISGSTDMFAVKVKGQDNVFPAYRVDISGPHIDYSYWVSDQPAAFLLFLLEPDGSESGAQLTLTEVKAGR